MKTWGLSFFLVILVFASSSAKANTAAFTNDPYLKKQKFFSSIGAAEAYSLLASGFAFSNSQPALIGVVDQGSIVISHPELLGQVFEESDFDDSPVGHGQFVLGIMAAKSNNGYGIAGVAGQFAQFLYRNIPTQKRKADLDQLAEVLRDFGRKGFDVVNLSFSVESNCRNQAPQSIDECHFALVSNSFLTKVMKETAQQYGTVFVIAAGNSFQELPRLTSPQDGIIVVGAANESRKLSSYSNYGAGVDLYVAEGGIYSLTRTGVAKPQQGTSFAAPVVSSVVGLVGRYLKNNGVQLTAGELAQLVVNSSQIETGLLKKNSSGRHLDFRKIALEAQMKAQKHR